MSGLVIASKTLLANAGVTAIVGSGNSAKIYPIASSQTAGMPVIVLHLIHEDEEKLLAGSSEWPVSRISVECRASTPPAVDILGKAVIAAFRNKHRYAIGGYEATFSKEGSDVTDASEETNTGGLPAVFRRIIDFHIRWRTAV